MMHNFRKVIGILLAMSMVVFALPAIGAQPTKKYRLAVETFAATTVTMHVSNYSNPTSGTTGTTNIGSFDVTVDRSAAGFTINPSQPAGVKLTRFVGLYPGTLSPGNPITGTVTLLPHPTDPVNKQVVAFTNFSVPLKGQETLRIEIFNIGCGLGTQWTEPRAYGSGNRTGQLFALDAPLPFIATTDVNCGNIACVDTQVTQSSFTIVRGYEPDSTSPVVVTRSLDQDGSCKTLTTPFQITNRFSVDNTLQLTWPNPLDEAFLFTANVSSVDARISWLNDPATNKPAYLKIVGNDDLTCSDQNSELHYFPRPYGTLAEPVLAGATKIKVSTTALDVDWPTEFPTNFFIGSKMYVVYKITNDTWWLQSPAGALSSGVLMYTPLQKLTAANVASFCVPIPGAPTGTCETLYGDEVGNPAKWCRIPGTGYTVDEPITNPPTYSPTGQYQITGNGDPIFSGGD